MKIGKPKLQLMKLKDYQCKCFLQITGSYSFIKSSFNFITWYQLRNINV